MNKLKNDIDSGTKTSEAEERNTPEAKVVEASHFQCERASSTLVGSTNGDEMIIGKNNGWQDFNNANFITKRKDVIVGGRDVSRLSVLQDMT